MIESIRKFFRGRITEAKSKRSFDGARHGRLTADWTTTQTSLDSDLEMSLQALIDRSRDLEQNNEYVAGFHRMMDRNVIGSTPFILQPKIEDGNGNRDDSAEKAICQGWKDWSKISECTVSGNMSLTDVYRLSFRAMLRDGAPIIRIHTGPSQGRMRFRVETLDIDYLDPSFNSSLKNGRRISMSVEQNEHGRPIAYWLLGHHPGDLQFVGGRKRTRVPAEDVIHPYFQLRAQQSRGYPAIAAMMMGLRQLKGYKEAEIVAARTAAAKMGFLRRDPGELGGFSGEESEGGGKYMDAAPGVIEDIGTAHFEQWDPTHPTTQYGEFVRECLRGVAFGLGVSYMTMANDLRGVSFSSGRIALLEEREEYKTLQRWFVEHVCEPIFERWLASALASGELGLPMTKFDKFNNPCFRPRRWQWIDPHKEVQGNSMAIEKGLASPERIIADQGYEEDEVLEEIEKTFDKRGRLGVLDGSTLDAAAKAKSMQEAQNQPQGETPLIASLGVGGTQGLIQVLNSIAKGEVTPQAGKKILVTVFGFKETDVEEIVGE